MRAAVAEKSSPGQIAIREVEMPIPGANEVLVRVAATSLTPGEIYYSQSEGEEKLLGCDFAGIVERPAMNGMGPSAGARVIGRVSTGAWAEVVAAPVEALAELPDDVSFEEGATLPTSALTALYALEKAGSLLGRSALITAANGSVGLYACQIARLMGATVVGQVRFDKHIELVMQVGAHHVVVDEDGKEAAKHGPYRLIADAVGGRVLTNIVEMLDTDGVCVTYGNMSEEDARFDPISFMHRTRGSIYSFIVRNEFALKPASDGLSRLARLVSEGKIRTQVALEEQAERIDDVVQELAEHKVEGKAVIRMWM